MASSSPHDTNGNNLSRPPSAAGSQSRVNVGRIERWVSSVGGGALSAVVVRRGYTRKRLGIFLLAAAGHALYRGITGRDRIYQALDVNTVGHDRGGVASGKTVKVEKTLTINRSPEELYRFWRNFEHLPQFMDHLQSVQVVDDRRSHWVAKAPAGTSVEWDAEIVDERPNEFIAWRSTGNPDVENAGSVHFKSAPGGRGTEVKVTLEYSPPGGVIGMGIAKLFGEEPSQQVDGDLRRFKNLMEAGEVPTIEGQPSGRD